MLNAQEHITQSNVLERNPRGQVAPQVQVTNCVAPNQPNNPRRGARRSRYLKRVQRPRQGGTENGPSRRRMPGGTPFSSDFFLKSEPYVHRPARKVVRQKKRTDIRQTISGPMRCGPGPGFGQLNVRYQSQNLSKGVPKSSSGSLLRTRLMSTSGLLRSLGLSSSWACGATCPAGSF